MTPINERVRCSKESVQTTVDRGIPLIWRDHPFASRAHVEMLPPGLSIAEMVQRHRARLPCNFAEHGLVLVNNEPVPRAVWHHVRPKVATLGGVPVIVNLCVPLQGGSSGGVLRTVALVAIAVAAIAVSGGALGPAGLGLLGPAFAAGQIGATLGAAAIPVGGDLQTGALS